MESHDNPLFFATCATDYHYLDNFNKALHNTRQLGFSVPRFALDPGFAPDLAELYEQVTYIVHREMHDCKNDERLPAFNCILYAKSVWRALEAFYSRPLMLTSGYLLGNNRKTFYEPFALLASRLAGPVEKPLNLHAWVTLPDLTVVDPTLLYSLRQIGAIDDRVAHNIFIRNVREQHNAEPFCYQPVLVGHGYWDSANAPSVSYSKR